MVKQKLPVSRYKLHKKRSFVLQIFHLVIVDLTLTLSDLVAATEIVTFVLGTYTFYRVNKKAVGCLRIVSWFLLMRNAMNSLIGNKRQ